MGFKNLGLTALFTDIDQVAAVSIVVRNISETIGTVLGIQLLEGCPAELEILTFGDDGMHNFSGSVVEQQYLQAERGKQVLVDARRSCAAVEFPDDR